MNLPAENVLRVEYFDFEKDFMDDGIRCIPMVVRFKLDACGIKLKLKEWSKMNPEQRESVANLPIDNPANLSSYRSYLEEITGEGLTNLSKEQINSAWMSTEQIPQQVREKLRELNVEFSVDQWASLSVLKRFTLLKLTRSGHENKNFPKALKEFGLISSF